MPHLVLQCSDGLRERIDAQRLFEQLHEQLSVIAGLAISNFKSRVQPQSDSRVVEGASTSVFVHLDIALLTRPPETRAALAEAALRILQSGLGPAIAGLDAQLTVYVHDLDPQAYRKVTVARAGAEGAT